MRQNIARLILLVVIGSTLFGITGTLGRYLFNDLRAGYWYGSKALDENIRVVKVEVHDVIFSNGDRINGNLMMPYNITATLILFAAILFISYCEIYFITYVLRYDIMKEAGGTTIPRLGTDKKQDITDETDVK